MLKDGFRRQRDPVAGEGAVAGMVLERHCGVELLEFLDKGAARIRAEGGQLLCVTLLLTFHILGGKVGRGWKEKMEIVQKG